MYIQRRAVPDHRIQEQISTSKAASCIVYHTLTVYCLAVTHYSESSLFGTIKCQSGDDSISESVTGEYILAGVQYDHRKSKSNLVVCPTLQCYTIMQLIIRISPILHALCNLILQEMIV
jgi:hypothetical protein